jgi:hypothetical protein
MYSSYPLFVRRHFAAGEEKVANAAEEDHTTAVHGVRIRLFIVGWKKHFESNCRAVCVVRNILFLLGNYEKKNRRFYGQLGLGQKRT